jgi:hypothetical protein
MLSRLEPDFSASELQRRMNRNQSRKSLQAMDSRRTVPVNAVELPGSGVGDRDPRAWEPGQDREVRFMAHARFTAHGSRFTAHGLRLTAHVSRRIDQLAWSALSPRTPQPS